MKIENVIIVTKPKQPDVARAAAQIADWFAEKGIRASLDPQSAR